MSNTMQKRYTLSDYWLFYTAGMSIREIIKDIFLSVTDKFDKSGYYLKHRGAICVVIIRNRLGIPKLK